MICSGTSRIVKMLEPTNPKKRNTVCRRVCTNDNMVRTNAATTANCKDRIVFKIVPNDMVGSAGRPGTLGRVKTNVSEIFNLADEFAAIQQTRIEME